MVIVIKVGITGEPDIGVELSALPIDSVPITAFELSEIPLTVTLTTFF
jgi:hypothetical protein